MTDRLPHLIRNEWDNRGSFLVARILDHHATPEGLTVERVRFLQADALSLDAAVGHIVSVIAGGVNLTSEADEDPTLRLSTSTHMYIPVGWQARIEAPAGAEILRVSGATPSQARGTKMLVRDEAFLAGCATGSDSLRWILTPQYLSRRIFLEHDATLLSRSGAPVSWYRTTMFDVTGLPPNDEGEPVFKMQYDSRTEFNVCYDVRGRARVRFAEHPYQEITQSWGPWLPIDGESTYHVNEAVESIQRERRVDSVTGVQRLQGNKHEVHIEGGYVTLFCLFDPAPAGFERHTPGEYSDYEPLGGERHAAYRRHLDPFDEMVDALSSAKARGDLNSLRRSTFWRLYLQGREAQSAHDLALLEALQGGGERDEIVAQWASVASVE